MVLSFLSLASFGCEPSTQRSPETLQIRSEGDTIRLSRSLLDVAEGRVLAIDLDQTLLVGNREPAVFGRVADVAALPGDRFAVLDRLQDEIVLFDELGTPTGTIGREGDGPGEFRAPWALEYSHGDFIIWENNSARTFTVLDSAGNAVTTYRRPISGDWGRLAYRYPLTFFNDYQEGPEDIVLRMRKGVAPGSWLQLVQEDERLLIPEGSFAPSSTTVRLVRFDYGNSRIDTVAAFPGPLVHGREEVPPGFARQYVQPLFSPRPRFAVGDGWYAVAHSDWSRVLVVWPASQDTIVVEWPRTSRPISREDREGYGDFWIAEEISSSVDAVRRWETLSSSMKQEFRRRLLEEETDFAENVPQMTGLWGAGRCLLLAGFDTSDTPFGVSRELVLLNVAEPTRREVIRLPRGDRVKDISTAAVFTVRKGSLGEWLVASFELPPTCRREDGTA